MTDDVQIISIAAAILAGCLLGGFYFGSLWWTVQRMNGTPHPFGLYFGSLVLRLALVLPAFFGAVVYFGWPELSAMLVGFVLTRLVLVRWLGRERAPETPRREAA